MFWLIPLGFFILSLVVMLIIAVRNIPKLRVIDVNSVQRERERRVKEQLFIQRIKRRSGSIRGLSKAAESMSGTVSKYGRRAVQRLYAMEQYYKKLKTLSEEGHHAYDKETVKKMMTQAQEFEKEGEQIPAEKMYIDIISHNPKHVPAYEALGNLYLKHGQEEQAQETLEFTLKLAPDDASVHVSLAELDMKLKRHRAALDHLRKAVDKRSKNPRYLDYYIQAALKAGSLKDARRGLTMLKEVNPENKKVDIFEKEFAQMKERYVQKVSTSSEKKDSQSSEEKKDDSEESEGKSSQGE